MIRPDNWIKKLALEKDMIKPFFEKQIRENVVSYGLSSYGYDIRVADEFRVFKNNKNTVMDPKKFDDECFEEVKGDHCIIPANSFVLARTVEYFKIPRNVLVLCTGKSTYARCGIIVNITPLEPEWEGYITMEISNTAPVPAKIYSNEGIGQVLFFESDEGPLISYKDKKGKYQQQTKITPPKI